MDLSGKVALITGAASGIGESTALLFAKEGAKLILTDINEEAGNALVGKIQKEGGEAVFVRVDTAVPSESQKSVEHAIEKFDKLDIAVNNAGISGPQMPAGEYEIEGWDKVISINLSGVFYGMRYQIPAMIKNGGGSIINISSILGSVGFPNACAYVAAKHGVLGLTKTAALDHGAQGIRVNAVGPAFIKTPLLENLDDQLLDQLVGLHPMGRLGEPQEVAELILWLASDKASFATGGYYPVDGGYLAR